MQRVKLEEIENQRIITISKGKQLSKENRENGIFPVIGAGRKSPYFSVKKNYEGETITISSSGAYAGYVWFHDYAFWASDCTVIQIEKEDKLNIKYLYLFLLSKQEKIYSFQTGAGQPHVYWKNIKTIEIPLPPIPQQKQIAQKLDKAKGLIELRKESIKKLDELSKSVFIEMFGDPLLNTKKYIKKRILELGKVQTGNTPPRKDIDNYGDFIEWIKSDNILKNKKYISKAKEYLSKKGYQKARIVSKDSLLFTCIAGSMSSIGNLAITDKEVTFNQQINSLTPKKHNVKYLYHLFQLTKRYFEENSTKSMKIMINKTTFENLSFPIAPVAEQQKFAKTIQKIEAQKALYEEQLVKLEYNFEALLGESFG